MSNKFEIKICGINDEISMNTAINLKVNYIGLVFYQNSPRNVSINVCKRLLKLRNKVSKIVALTVNPKDDLLNEIEQIEMMGGLGEEDDEDEDDLEEEITTSSPSPQSIQSLDAITDDLDEIVTDEIETNADFSDPLSDELIAELQAEDELAEEP